MKNYNSKENKWTDIKSKKILGRAKHCQYLQSKGKSVKELAEMYKLSESRIRQYLKQQIWKELTKQLNGY